MRVRDYTGTVLWTQHAPAMMAVRTAAGVTVYASIGRTTILHRGGIQVPLDAVASGDTVRVLYLPGSLYPALIEVKQSD